MSAFHKDALPVGYELEEYTIEAVLGHGGFGITYRADDRHLQAKVAIKEYFPAELATRQDIAAVVPKDTPKATRDYHAGLKNFVKEARALARFKHPNIVRVLRYLETNGTAYMVMEYERGRSLADHLRQYGPCLDESALHRVFLPILNGVQAVHEVDMLHLDIKPENIYLREDGTPMLIDFGSTRQAISHTMPDKFLVTHGYAPIEQYPDKGKQGPWTDIYALGASMYRCISGKRPINALERYQAVLTYRVDPLTPAVTAGKDRYTPLLLECIDWALQVHPRERPQTVREFQNRLLRKSGTTTRTTATTSATRTTTATTTRSTASTTGGARKSAPRAHPRHVRAQRRNWLPLLLLLAIAAGAYALYMHPPVALQRLVDAPDAPVRDNPAMPPVVVAEKPVDAPATPTARPPSPAPTLYQTLEGHSDGVLAVAFSASGGRLASAGADGKVRIWDSTRGTALATLDGHVGAVTALAFSPDGRWLASGGRDGSVRLWDARALAAHGQARKFGGPLHAVAFSHDGKRLAAAGRSGRLTVWDVAGAQPPWTLTGHRDDVYAVAFSSDGQWIASGGADRTARLWSATHPGEAVSQSVHRSSVQALAFSPDSRWLTTGTQDRVIRMIETGAGTQVRTLASAPAPVQALAFQPDGAQIVVGTADPRVQLVDVTSGKTAHALDGGGGAVTALAVSVDGRLIAAGARDGRVRLWRQPK